MPDWITKSRRKAHWKNILIGAIAVGVGMVCLSRAQVAYVLYQHQNAKAPSTTYIETIDKYSYFSSGKVRRIWKTSDKKRWSKYAQTRVPIQVFSVHQVCRDKKSYFWTSHKMIDAEQYSVSKEAPSNEIQAKPSLGQAVWSIPWLFRMPDRYTNGHRQWILQQTLSRSQNYANWTVWGFSAETGRLSWIEDWSQEGKMEPELLKRTVYTYDSPIPDSVFEVPNLLKTRDSEYTESSWPEEPDFTPAVRTFSWSWRSSNWEQWWNTVLVGR
ncbi:MAG: hypothetical protein QM758_15440 [Armatimonas sp.]